jgi:hypothetical protein
MMYPLQLSGAIGQISTIAAPRFKQYWIVSEMMYVCNAHQALARRKRGTNREQSRWVELNYHNAQEYKFGRVVTLEE